MSVHDFQVQSLEGEPVPLKKFEGNALLIVNVASKCGFTRQYSALEALHRRYSPKGFSVLGFPCNQFGNQEPGDADSIRSFCHLTYNVTFPMFEKIEVNGANTHPLYAFLKRSARGLFGTQQVKWNFTKFLVDRSGKVVKRFAPTTSMDIVEKEVAKLVG